jgi:hypothetical protein
MNNPHGHPLTAGATDTSQGWMILTLNSQSWAVSGQDIAGVYRTSEATQFLILQPPAQIEVQGGRPWFIVPPARVMRDFLGTAEPVDPTWTVAFKRPAGVALHMDAVEGPYRGVVMQGVLKTTQGNWPVMDLKNMELG